MIALRQIAPAASIAALILLAALPLGLSPDNRFWLPLLPVVAIHYWALRQDALIPEWLVFAAGLTLDILSHGPLGYWSVIYLATYFLAVASQPLAERGVVARLVSLVAALAAVTFLAWAVASLYLLEVAQWQPFARGAVFAALAIAVLLPLLRALDGSRREVPKTIFARGS